MYDLCVTYLESGRYREREELAQQVVEDQIEVLGERNVSTLRTRVVFGESWRILGLFQKAASIESQVLEKATEVLAQNDVFRIDSIAKRACMWVKLGLYEQAEQAETQVLELRIETAPPLLDRFIQPRQR